MTTTPAVEPLDFPNWIRDHADGVASDEASAAIANVVQAVGLIGKKGSVRIDIDIVPKGRVSEVTVKVSSKPPEPTPTPAIYFADGGGGLHRDDPYQDRLPFTAVINPDPEPAAVIDPETGEITRPTTSEEN